MYFRVRTTLTDRPGALATLAARCGEAGVNILGLQIFPDLGSVTDELVVKTPDTWTPDAVAELVSGAGGDEVSVEACTTHDLVDQATRWLSAARDVLGDAALLPSVLHRLLGPTPESWSATEHVRAATLTEIAQAGHRPTGSPRGGADVVAYEVLTGGVQARIGGHVVGDARIGSEDVPRLTIEVAPAWRRLGIGTALLTTSAGVAKSRGAQELLLISPATDEATVPMLAKSGMRGLIRLSGGELSVRVGLGQVRPYAATPTAV